MKKTFRFFLWGSGPALLVLLALGLSSCTNLGYYARSTKGHLEIISRSQPIPSLLASEDVDPEVKASLAKVLEMRDFASRELGLPENGSYRSYVDVQRPHVLWNVVAAPEFELAPMKWCFPIAGCVNYRGFFSEEEAKGFAADLREEGYDVYLYGVSAYSTLGWFDDPVLNTFLYRSEPDLAGLIFHELAHQKIYVKGDSAFSESFAKAVELEGVWRWLEKEGKGELTFQYLEARERERDFLLLVEGAQAELKTLYARSLGEEARREEKSRIFRQLVVDYGELKKEWGGYSGYDRWFSHSLNNAKLALVATYRTYVPSFRALLQQTGGDFQRFYSEVEKIAKLGPEQKVARLEGLHLEYLAQKVASAPVVSEPSETVPESSPSPEG